MRIIVFLIGCLCGMSLFSLRAQQVWNPDNQNGTFTNPIMWGDWPDPDLIRVDDKFYLVSTSSGDLLKILTNTSGKTCTQNQKTIV